MSTQRLYRTMTNRKLNVVIFSKDRACQLDLLMRSIEKFFVDKSMARFTVIYTYSDGSYQSGYDRLRSRFPDYHYVDQNGASDDFKSMVSGAVSPSLPFTMFLVDDDLLKSEFRINDGAFRQFAGRHDVLCLSLRLGKHINYCYPLNIATPPPAFVGDWSWRWQGLAGDWGYPMSLDGHVFRTEELLPLLQSRRYVNPNTLEASMAARPLSSPYMMCFEYSRILNLPLNRVQNTYPNRCAGVDPASLNARYVDERQIIDLGPFEGLVNESVHQEIPLRFVESK